MEGRDDAESLVYLLGQASKSNVYNCNTGVYVSAVFVRPSSKEEKRERLVEVSANAKKYDEELEQAKEEPEKLLQSTCLPHSWLPKTPKLDSWKCE